jgi:hypothetical protein
MRDSNCMFPYFTSRNLLLFFINTNPVTGLSYLEPLQLSHYSDWAENYIPGNLGSISDRCRDFFLHSMKIAQVPTQLPMHGVPEGGAHSPRLNLTHLYLVRRLRMRGAIPSFPPYVFMAL